jgi:hypothetical protein
LKLTYGRFPEAGKRHCSPKSPLIWPRGQALKPNVAC